MHKIQKTKDKVTYLILYVINKINKNVKSSIIIHFILIIIEEISKHLMRRISC